MKAFLSYLRIFLLSFGLMHLQMLPVYAQAQSQAHEDFQEAVVENAQRESAESNSSGQMSRTKTAQGEDVTSQANMGTLTNMLTMIGVGLIGYALYTYTPVTMDMMIAGAAGVAYIAGEIMALKATKEKMKSETFVLTVREDGTQDNMQKKALEEQKKSYESLAKLMDQKSMLQKVAAAGFVAAAAAAMLQKVQLESMRMTCSATLQSYAWTCGPYNLDACKCSGALASIGLLESQERATEETPNISSVKFAALETVGTSKDTTIATGCSAVAGSCGPATAYRRLVNSMNPIMSSGAGTMIAGAVASVALKQLGLGSLSGLTMAIFGPFSQKIDLWLATPTNRAIAYGGLAALSFANASISTGLAEKMRSNVQKIDELLQQMNRLQNVQPANLVASTQLTQNGFFMAANRSETDKLESKSMPCADGKPRNSKGECTSLKKSIDEGIKTTLSGMEGIPDGFVNSAGQIGSVADDMINNGGLSSGSLDAANNLLANSNAIRNLNRRIQDKINEDRKSKGEDAIDFEKQQAGFVDEMTKAMIKGMKDAQGQDSSSMMAAMQAFGSMDPSKVADAEQVEEGEKLVDATSVDAQVSEVPAFQVPEAPKFDFGAEDGDFANQENGEVSDSALAYNENGEMQVSISEDYETSESSEIVTNKDVSIFRVISVRYLKSGIPKLIGLEE